jgi:hypothetical protein
MTDGRALNLATNLKHIIETNVGKDEKEGIYLTGD